MSAVVKCAVFVNRFLNSRPQYVKNVSVRYYPRWSHRRPVRIVENNSSPEECERWKLGVEREIVQSVNSKTCTLEDISSPRRDSFREDNSRVQAKEYMVDESYPKYKRDLKIERTFSAAINYKQKHFHDNSNVSPSQDINDSKRNFKSNIQDLSFKSNEETRKQKLSSSKTLEKRKIYDTKELDEAVKLQESANKLGVPVFTDLGTNDTILSKYLTNVKSRKKREKIGKILLEGKRLIRDAIDAGAFPEAVFFSRIKDLKDLNLPDEGVKIYKLIYKKFCLWSDVTTSQGVLAILKTPDVNKERPASLPLTVICDNVRDPGNLGSILRTCAAVGCKEVILTKGCVDLWDTKVLRAGAGAHFRLSITQADNWEAVIDKTDENSCVCIAESKIVKDSLSHRSDELNNKSTTATDSDSDDDVNLQRSEVCKQESDLVVPPVVPYYALNYASLPSVVLIVGGETEGVSFEAYKFASEASGVLLNIPLSNNVDSLNCGTALSIIAFEMKKQYCIKANTTDPVMKEHMNDSDNSKATVMNI